MALCLLPQNVRTPFSRASSAAIAGAVRALRTMCTGIEVRPTPSEASCAVACSVGAHGSCAKTNRHAGLYEGRALDPPIAPVAVPDPVPESDLGLAPCVGPQGGPFRRPPCLPNRSSWRLSQVNGPVLSRSVVATADPHLMTPARLASVTAD